MKQSFSTSEVAAYCHVTADTIRKWAEAGRIHVFKTPGGHRRIRREDLLRFLRENGIPIHSDLRDAGAKVLIIDTSAATVAAIQRFLERASTEFLIETAEDAFHGGYGLASFQPDIIFLDMGLPGLDGPALCRSIKERIEHAAAQIIAMAPAEAAEAGSLAVAAGAAVALKKPITPDDMRRSMAQLGFEVS